MSDNIMTGLYPSGANRNTSFNVLSDCIKVFPSSWRGADIKATQVATGYVIDGQKQFNPESALHTEYNITRTAGGLKSFIDYAAAKTLDGKTVYDIKFFIKGYAFEIFNLDLSRYGIDTDGKSKLIKDSFDLYAGIRVGDLNIGDADLDDTKVLMPYYWTAINTPISLDATLQDAYLIDAKDGTTVSDLVSSGSLYGGVSTDQILASPDNTYIFTGLVLSTGPLDDDDNYYSLKLFENSKLCYGNYYPEAVKGGRPDGKSTVIGKGLKAPVANMLAVGEYNTSTELDSNGNVPVGTQRTLFAVGNGFDENKRRNAFEVLGRNEGSTFESTVIAGGVKFTYNNTKENYYDGRGDIETVHLINRGTEILEDGSGIKINRPIDAVCQRRSDIGVHSYGNINLLSQADYNGSKLQFKTFSFDEDKTYHEKIISTFQVVEVATGQSNIIDPDASGLKMTNIHDINDEALVFRPYNGGLTRSRLKTINKSIDIDNISDYKHSIKIGLDSNESAALSLADGKLVIKSDSTGEFIDKIKIEADNNDCDHLYNVAGIHNKKDTSSVTFDGKLIKLNGDVEITGTSTFKGLMNIDVNEDIAQNGLAKFICNLIYPVGSIYMTMENINPGDKFGGTWKQISQGRMLIGAGTASDQAKQSASFTVPNPPSNENWAEWQSDTGGFYNTKLPSHTHEKGKLKVAETHTEDCEATNFRDSTSTPEFFTINTDYNSHNHETTGKGLHSHNIPVSYAISYAGYNHYADPRSFLSIDQGILGNDLYANYKGHKGEFTRYWGLLNEKIKAPIPLVSMGTWHEGCHILNWCGADEQGYSSSEIKPNLSDTKESNVRTGYFGISGVAEEDFKNYVESLFRTTFIHNFKFSDGDSGSRGTGDGYANDEFIVRKNSTADIKYFFIPSTDKDFWTTTFGWTVEEAAVDYGKNDGNNWCYNDTYAHYEGKCYRVINKEAPHTEYLFKNGNDISTTKEVEKDDIKDAFMRDLFNAIENGRRLHREDGYHTHSCTTNEHNHSLIINYDKLTHKHPLKLNISGSTASAGTSDTLTNLPPYLVCYIWQRIK